MVYAPVRVMVKAPFPHKHIHWPQQINAHFWLWHGRHYQLFSDGWRHGRWYIFRHQLRPIGRLIRW